MAVLSLTYLSKNPLKKRVFMGLPGFLALSCLGFLMALPIAPAQAAQSAQSSNQANAEKPSKKKQSTSSKKADAAEGSTANRPAKASFLPSSQEPTSVRNARLKRECKGRVNAGACAGFTY